MEISLSQIKIYIFGWIILSMLYMVIYRFKGTRQDFEGYFQAIQSCICYGVVSLFVVFGIFIVKEIIVQRMYIGLIIPIVWGMIGYSIIKAALKRDFSLNIRIIKRDFDILEKMLRIVILLFFFGVFLFMAGALIYLGITEVSDDLIRMIIMIFFGIICLGGGIIVLNDFLNKYTSKRLRINMKMLVSALVLLMILIFILAIFL